MEAPPALLNPEILFLLGGRECSSPASGASPPRITVSVGDDPAINLAPDWSRLHIEVPHGAHTRDCIIQIGVLQAMFRFAALHSAAQGWLLLHCSTAAVDTFGVCFGDDGSSSAKTWSSVEYALRSGFYVGDEFCFFSLATGSLYGSAAALVHLRTEVEEHLESRHNLPMPQSLFHASPAGRFARVHDLFLHRPRVQLTCVFFVHRSSGEPRVETVTGASALAAMSACGVAHIVKLLHPECDRLSMVRGDDAPTKAHSIGPYTASVVERLALAPHIRAALAQLDLFRLYVRQPCDVIDLVNGVLSRSSE